MVTAPATDPKQMEIYHLGTNLLPTQVAQSFVAPETVPFWSLPRLASDTESAGLDAVGYRLRFQQLLALPTLLAAMVLIAACFSLKLSRMGGVGLMVLGGVGAGFVLYVSSKLVSDLGASGHAERARRRLVASDHSEPVGRLDSFESRGRLMARTDLAPMATISAANREGVARLFRARVSWFALTLALGAALTTIPAVANAQTLADRFSGAANSDDKAPMNVDADKVTYNDRDHTVVATGDVQIYYKKKTLEADKVTYYRDSGRVLAEGSVKLTDSDGSVTHADRMELSGDFKRGFVDAARSDSGGAKDRTHMTATRTERLDEETTVFEKGAYTACESCADHPERAPVWRLRAQKIIHKNSEQTLYYENATFDLFGVPIAWLPYLSTPDPSVRTSRAFWRRACPTRTPTASASASPISTRSRRTWTSR